MRTCFRKEAADALPIRIRPVPKVRRVIERDLPRSGLPAGVQGPGNGATARERDSASPPRAIGKPAHHLKTRKTPPQDRQPAGNCRQKEIHDHDHKSSGQKPHCFPRTPAPGRVRGSVGVFHLDGRARKRSPRIRRPRRPSPSALRRRIFPRRRNSSTPPIRCSATSPVSAAASCRTGRA